MVAMVCSIENENKCIGVLFNFNPVHYILLQRSFATGVANCVIGGRLGPPSFRFSNVHFCAHS